MPDPFATSTAAKPVVPRSELPAALFAAYLDNSLKDSTGLFLGGNNSLERAQIAQLRFVAEQLEVTGSKHLMDLGCGWGSVILFMALHHGCTATGVTQSAAQAQHILRQAEYLGVSELVEVRLEPLAELGITGQYDAVTMLGSLTRSPDRTEMLTAVHDLLRPGGRVYLSESCFRDTTRYLAATRDTVTDFAGMVPLSQLVQSVEAAGLALTGLADLTTHYRRTMVCWETNALSNKDRITKLVPGYYETLIEHLHTMNEGWSRTIRHYGLTAAKPGHEAG